MKKTKTLYDTGYFPASRETVLNIIENNPFTQMLGVGVVEVDYGRLVLKMSLKKELTNVYGVIHGGALASLADTAMGIVATTVGKRVVTADFNMNFLLAEPPEGKVIVVATILHDGNKLQVSEAEITDEKGQLVAKARGTMFVIQKIEAGE